jgi:hypothetical protein
MIIENNFLNITGDCLITQENLLTVRGTDEMVYFYAWGKAMTYTSVMQMNLKYCVCIWTIRMKKRK